MQDQREQIPLARKSSLVTIIAIGSLIFSTWALVSDVVGLTSLVRLSNDPLIDEALQYLESQSASQSLRAFSQWYLPFTIVSIGIDLLTVFASIGLFQRKETMRKLFLSLVVVTWLSQSVTSVSGWLALRSSAVSTGQKHLPEAFTSLYGLAVGMWVLVLLMISSFLMWKLSSKEVRQEFSSPAPGSRLHGDR